MPSKAADRIERFRNFSGPILAGEKSEMAMETLETDFLLFCSTAVHAVNIYTCSITENLEQSATHRMYICYYD